LQEIYGQELFKTMECGKSTEQKTVDLLKYK